MVLARVYCLRDQITLYWTLSVQCSVVCCPYKVDNAFTVSLSVICDITGPLENFRGQLIFAIITFPSSPTHTHSRESFKGTRTTFVLLSFFLNSHCCCYHRRVFIVVSDTHRRRRPTTPASHSFIRRPSNGNLYLFLSYNSLTDWLPPQHTEEIKIYDDEMGWKY